ncbi:MAG: hypothetical protein M1113_04450 [Candidatus Thermoplasmatota archaeon]|nr:hypothetical protein [Candidatus Thermoplasmatota archaeon]
MGGAICSGIFFDITGNKSPSFLQNHYKLGKIVDGSLILNNFECVFLYYKKRIDPVNPIYRKSTILLGELLREEGETELYIVYETLKIRGYYVKRERNMLFARKSPQGEYTGPIIVKRENSTTDFPYLYSNTPAYYFTLDEDGDITAFHVTAEEMSGMNKVKIPENINIERVGGRFVTDNQDIPDWYGQRFKDLRILSDFETGYHRSDAGEGSLNRIYSDLVDRRFIVKSGFKYGSHFRAYVENIQEHAEFLIHYLEGPEEWYKISRAVRVANGVRKRMIFCGYIDKRLLFVEIKRIRDPFSGPSTEQ